MSRENVEVVRRVYEAVDRREAATVLALYDPDVEWDASRTPAGDLSGSSVHRGHDGLRRWFHEWYEAWEGYEDHWDLIDAGDRVISVGFIRARGRASGIEVEFHRAGVWTIRDGKVVKVVWYDSREEALEAVGLRE